MTWSKKYFIFYFSIYEKNTLTHCSFFLFSCKSLCGWCWSFRRLMRRCSRKNQNLRYSQWRYSTNPEMSDWLFDGFCRNDCDYFYHYLSLQNCPWKFIMRQIRWEKNYLSRTMMTRTCQCKLAYIKINNW